MPPMNRDENIIRHILQYCCEIKTAHEDFLYSKDKFMCSSTYRNAINMPILQIGELANHLSEAFKAQYTQISWNEMRGIRNLMAYQYHSVDYEIIWNTACQDIPELAAFCQEYLSNSK